MSTRQNVVLSMAGRASDATVRAEAVGGNWVSLRMNNLLAYVHNQRVIREMRRTIQDAERLATVQQLPATAPTMPPPTWDAISAVHFGESITAHVYFDGRIKNRPLIRIETPPVIWIVIDRMALDQFSDLWAAAGALGTSYPAV